MHALGDEINVGSFKTIEEANDIEESLVQQLSTTNYE